MSLDYDTIHYLKTYHEDKITARYYDYYFTFTPKFIGYTNQLNERFLEIKKEVTNITNHKCAIILPDEVISNISKIKIISIRANDFWFAGVNIIENPEAVNNKIFYPFYADKNINLYELDCRYNTISICTEDINGEKRAYTIIDLKEDFETKSLSSKFPEEIKFLMRTHDGCLAIMNVKEGAIGADTYPFYSSL